MADAHANFAYSLVATAPSTPTAGTSLVVTTGEGAKFPAVPFNAVIWPANAQPSTTNAEIVRVTGRSTDTLTITRAQESTSARTVVVGDQISGAITAKTLTDVETAAAIKTASVTLTVQDTFQRFTITDATVTATSKIVGTIVRGAIADVDDPGWHYTFTVVNRAAGTFDVTIHASTWGEQDGDSLGLLGAPNETLTFCYLVQ